MTADDFAAQARAALDRAYHPSIEDLELDERNGNHRPVIYLETAVMELVALHEAALRQVEVREPFTDETLYTKQYIENLIGKDEKIGGEISYRQIHKKEDRNALRAEQRQRLASFRNERQAGTGENT